LRRAHVDPDGAIGGLGIPELHSSERHQPWLATSAAGSGAASPAAEVTEMEMISTPEPDGTAPSIQRWPDSGSVAVITWRTKSGEVYQQELGDEQEAIELVSKITADDQLDLVSAQLRRVGIGPDS